MSIATEITRLQTAKADLKTAIEAKGVSVPSTALISDYDTYVSQITGGGGTGTTIPSYITARHLFSFGRFASIYQDLLDKFEGIDCYYIWDTNAGQYPASGTILSAFCNKALQNAVNVSSGNINLSYLTGGSMSINQADNDFILDGENINLPANRTIQTSSMLDINNTAASIGHGWNNVSISLLNSNSTGKWYITGSLGTLRHQGIVDVEYYYGSAGTYTPFNYNNTVGFTGTFHSFHIVPTFNNVVLNFSNIPSTALTETTLINSLALYNSSELTNRNFSIKLDATLYSSLQQSTIDAATALGIRLTT